MKYNFIFLDTFIFYKFNPYSDEKQPFLLDFQNHFLLLFLVISQGVLAQGNASQKSDFWQRVQIGGGVGVSGFGLY
jgi:hypothetical protein